MKRLFFLMHCQRKAFVYLDSFSLTALHYFLRLITTSTSEGEGEKIESCPLRMSHLCIYIPQTKNELHWHMEIPIVYSFFNIAVTPDVSFKPRANKKTFEHPTRFSSMKVTKTHLPNAHWSEEWASATAMSKNRDWNLICTFLMSAPNDALKCNYTGSSWRSTGS